MAVKRMVNTDFWRDTYITELEPTEKLLFLYLLTNPQTNLAGVYEITLRQMAFDTGLDVRRIKKNLDKFAESRKIAYVKGWVVLKNFAKHQRPNDSIKRGIEKAMADLPEWLQKTVVEIQTGTDWSQTGDRLYTIETKLNKSKIKLNSTNVLLADEPAKKTSKENLQVVENKSKPEINNMFAYWQEQIGYAITSNMQKNRFACSNLLKRYGVEKLQALIRVVAYSSQDAYAPRVSDFVSLQAKQNELAAWLKRKGSEANATAQF